VTPRGCLRRAARQDLGSMADWSGSVAGHDAAFLIVTPSAAELA
jgi:hypothetical protein